MAKAGNKLGLKELQKLIRPAFTEEQLEFIPETERENYRNYKIFPIGILVKADWNYKNEDIVTSSKLQNNLKKNGQVENIQVRILKTGFYEVVNGNHRYDDMCILGREYVMCYDHGKITDSAAKKIAIETNETKFSADQLKLAGLMSELVQDYGLDELVTTLPFSGEEIENLVKLVEFDYEKFIDDRDRGEPEVKPGVEIKFRISDEANVIWEGIKEFHADLGGQAEIFEHILNEFKATLNDGRQ